MTVSFSQAVSAYTEAASKAAKGATGADEDAGTNFAELVARAAGGAVDTARQGEQMSVQAVADQANLQDVVTAVTNAEVTLQTVVAIRDRVIQAYQDIIRMPI